MTFNNLCFIYHLSVSCDLLFSVCRKYLRFCLLKLNCYFEKKSALCIISGLLIDSHELVNFFGNWLKCFYFHYAVELHQFAI